MKIDARGSQKEPHRSNFAPQGVLWSPPGASWAPSRPQKGALGGKEEFENCVEGSWDHLGVLLARLGPILGRISPPLGGPYFSFYTAVISPPISPLKAAALV